MKMKTWKLLGVAEEKVVIVGKREKTEASGRVQTELGHDRKGEGGERNKEPRNQPNGWVIEEDSGIRDWRC